MTKNKVSRRNFIRGIGAVGSFMILPNWVIGKSIGPNSKVNVAIVGVGGRGGSAVKAFSNEKCPSQIVALCDVDESFDKVINTYKRFPDTPKFFDYRVMLDKMNKDIDAVAIITPDFSHYPIGIWAMSMGKHCYCEKPLTRTVWESREMEKYAKKYKVITQMGNQGHTNEGWRVVKEWADSGFIGEPKEVYCWTNRPIWPQGNLSPQPAEPIPAGLKYNDWLNVAPFQDYYGKLLPFNWRGLRNYGTGAAGDMACHFLDIPYFGLDLGNPTSVVCTSSKGLNNYSWPSRARVEMVFPKTDKRGPVKLVWCDGNTRPEANIPNATEKDMEEKNSIFIVGSKEVIKTNHYGSSVLLHPRERMKELAKEGKVPPKTITRSTNSGNPHHEWINAILKGVQPPSNFGISAPFTEMCLLMMCAVSAGQDVELKYDAKTMSFPNRPEANKYLRSLYDYRKEFLPSNV